METLLTTFKSVGTITSYILRVHLWTKGVQIQKSKRFGSSEEDQCQHCSPQWREWTQTVLQLGGVTDFFLRSHWKREYSFCRLSRDETRLSIDEKPKHNNGDDNDDFNNWQSPCKWMVCSALLLIHQISMNSIKATAPSQDFFCYKQCRYRSSFSFCDWLRIWRRLNCSPLKPLTCSCIDFSSYNRPWRRGFGKNVWGMENA